MNIELAKQETSRSGKLLIKAWRLALAVWIALALWPVAYGTTRIVQAVLFAFCWLTAIWIWRQRRLVRWCLLMVTAAALILCLAPGRASSPLKMRERYQHELRRYEGVRYVWGGESRLGIDCSGLVRRALFQVLWKEGLLNLNPTLVRGAISIWYNDASARALAQEYHQQTRSLRMVDALNAESNAGFWEGDLAITTDGVHVLAYLGDGNWIEADPDFGRVILLPTPNAADESNIWLTVPMYVVRWRILDTNGHHE